MRKNYNKLILTFLCFFAFQGYGQITIYNETFGSAAASLADFSSGSFPATWTDATIPDWVIDDGTAGLPNCTVGGSSAANMMISLDGTSGTNVSITKAFSTSGLINITVKWNALRFTGSSQTLALSWSLDNITYTVQAYTPVTADDAWHAVSTVTLPAAAQNKATVYLKWTCVSSGGGEYEAIDDILVEGITSPVYYWNGVGALHLLSSWGTSSDGSGTAPTSFTASGQEFNIVNAASASLASTWTVSGASTKLFVGDGSSSNVNFTIPATFSLNLGTGASTCILICSPSSTITLANTIMPPVNSFSLNTNSTVDYAQGSNVTLLNLTYENLTISGGSNKTQASNITVNKVLSLQNNFRMSNSSLQNLNLNGTITGSGSLETGGSRLNINGSGAFGTINFATGSTASTINTFSVNRSAGAVTIGSNFTVTATSALTTGTLDLNGKSLTANGAITITSGILRGSTSSSLTIGGAGAITGSLMMDGASSSSRSLSDLTLNRAGQTLTLGNALEIINHVTPTAGTLGSGGNLTLKSSSARKARLGVVGGSVTGNIIVETFALGGSTGWTNLGPSGVTGLSVSSWDGQFPMSCSGCINDEMSPGGRFVSIQGWNEGGSGGTEYVELTGGSALSAGLGYWVYLGDGFSSTGDLTWTVTGPPVTGNKLVPITNSAQAGFNLVSNPYPSPISWNAVQAVPANAGLASAIYVWDPDAGGGSGATVSMSGGVSVPGGLMDDNIPMGQGFYIDASGGPAGNLTFTEACKSTGNTGQLLKSAASPTIGQVFRLTVAGSSGDNDETAIRFHTSATNAYDKSLDAHKIFKSPGYLGYPGVYTNYTTISTRLSNEDYSINSLPYAVTADAIIPVLVKVVATGAYTISPIDIDQFPPTACVTLKDKFLNVTHNLRTGPYVCTISDTTTTPRFELIVCKDASNPSSVTGIDGNASITPSILLINQNENGPYVKMSFETSTKATISAYNVMGQKLMTDKEVEGKELTTYLDLGNIHNQVVIIKVTTADQSITKKLFVN